MSVKSKSKMRNLFTKFRKSTTDLSEWNKHDEKLLKAIEDEDAGKVESLVAKKGILTTKLDPQGHTAFHRAAAHGKLDIVNILISHGADTAATDVQGRTALSCAARNGRPETVERLLMVNNNPGAEDHKKQAALHHACMGGSVDSVRVLVKYGADVNQPDKNWKQQNLYLVETAQCEGMVEVEAARYEQTLPTPSPSIRPVKTAGTQRVNDGRSPLFYAAQMGFTSICKELVENSANINQRDHEKKSPLILACEHGNVAVCDFLIKKGANVLLTDDHGHNATWYANSGAYTDIKTLLDNAPMIASWDLGPAKREDENNAVGDDVTPVNGFTSCDSPVLDVVDGLTDEDKVNYGVVPMEQFRDEVGVTGNTEVRRVDTLSSKVKVNYRDEEDEEEEEREDNEEIVPMEEMIHAQRERPEKVQIVQQVRMSPLELPPPADPPSPSSSSSPPAAVDTSFTVLPVLKVERARRDAQTDAMPEKMLRDAQTDAMPDKTRTVSVEEFKELEEEHEMLSDEMQKVTIENKHYQEKIQQLEGKLQQDQTESMTSSMVDMNEMDQLNIELTELRSSLHSEREKTGRLEEEVESLREQLLNSQKSVSHNDSWGDSDEELFDSPDAKKKSSSSSSSRSKQVATLTSQLLDLQKENQQLKEKIQKSEVDGGFYRAEQLNVSSSSLVTDLHDLAQLEAFQQAHENEVKGLTDQISQLNSQIEELTEANKAAYYKEQELTATINTLKAELTEASEEVNHKEQEHLAALEKLELRLSEASGETSQKEQQQLATIFKLQTQLTEASGETSQKEQEQLATIHKLQTQLTEASGETNQREQEQLATIHKLQTQLIEANEQFSEKELNHLASVEKLKAELTEANEAANHEEQELLATINTLKTELEQREEVVIKAESLQEVHAQPPVAELEAIKVEFLESKQEKTDTLQSELEELLVEKQKFKDTQKEHLEEIDDLKRQITTLKSNIVVEAEKSETVRNKTQIVVDDLNAELSKLKVEVESGKEVEALKAVEVESLRTELASKDSLNNVDVEDYESEIERLNVEIGQYRSQVDELVELKEEVATLRNVELEAAKVSLKCKELNEENDDLKGTVLKLTSVVAESEEIEEKYTEQVEEIEELRAEVQNSEKRNANSSELEQLLRDQSEEINLLQGEIDQLNNAIADASNKELKYVQQIDKLQDELNNLGDSYVQATELEDMYKVELAQHKEEVAELQEQEANSVEQTGIHLAQIEDLQCQVNEIKQERNAMRTAIPKLEAEIKEYKVKCEELEILNEKVGKEVPEKVQTELKNLRERVVGLENEKSSLLKRVLHRDGGSDVHDEKLNQQLKQSQEQLKQSQEQLKQSQEQLAQFSRQFEELRQTTSQQITLQNAALQNAQSDNAQVEQAFVALQSEMSKVAQRVKELEAENEDLMNRPYEIPDAYREELRQAQEDVQRLGEEKMMMLSKPQDDLDAFFHLQNRIAELEEENERLMSQGQSQVLKVMSGSEEQMQWKAEAERLRAQVDMSDKEKEELRDRMEELMEARNYMEQELSNLHRYIEGVRSRSATPVNSSTVPGGNSAVLQELIEGKVSMEEDLIRLQKSIESMQAKNSTPTQIQNELYDEVQRVRNENNRLNEELEEMHEASDSAKKEIERLRREVATAQEQSKALQELAHLNTQLQSANERLKHDFSRKMADQERRASWLTMENERLSSENERLSTSGNESSENYSEKEHERIVERIERVEVHQSATLMSSPLPYAVNKTEESTEEQINSITMENRILAGEVKQLKKKLDRYSDKYVEGLVADNERIKAENVRLHETVRRHSKSRVSEDSSTRSSPSLDMSIDSGYVRKCERLEKEKDKLRDELKDMKDFMQSQAGELERISKKHEEISTDFDNLKREKIRLEESVTKQRAEIDKLAKHNEELEFEVEEINRIRSEIEELNQSQADELSKFIQNDEALKREITHLQSKHKEMEEVCQQKDKEVKASVQKLKKLDSEVVERNVKIVNYQKDVEVLKGKMNELEHELEEKKKNPSRAENEKLLDEYLRIQEEMCNIKEKNGKLSTERDDLRKKWVSKEQECDEKVARYAVECTKLEDKVKKLESQVKLHTELSKKSSALLRQDGRQGVEAARLREVELRCGELQGEVMRLGEECERLGEEKEAMGREREEAVQRLREENGRLQQQADKLSEELSQRSEGSGAESGGGGPDDVRELHRKLHGIQQELQENERKNREIVSTYRTHLLAAVQGRMDQEVKQALLHIIKLRHTEQMY